jgi:hypothetical protein
MSTPLPEIKGRFPNQKPPHARLSTTVPYQQKPSLDNAFRLGGQSALVGVVLAGLRNALAGQNLGFVAPVGLFGAFPNSLASLRLELMTTTKAAVGATFALTESVVANQRQTNDAVNGAAGELYDLGVH